MMPSISPTVGRAPAKNSFMDCLAHARDVLLSDADVDSGETLWAKCKQEREAARGRALTQHQSDRLRSACRMAWTCRFVDLAQLGRRAGL